MNEEIKEILEDYKQLAGKITLKLDNTAEYENWLIIQCYFDKLSDYITNLQDENSKLKMRNDILRKDIDKLQEGLFMCNELKENYKKCNEQAITWIKAKLFYVPNIHDLIKILQNGDGSNE